MRRRDYLRSAAGTLGLGGLTASALRVAADGSDRAGDGRAGAADGGSGTTTTSREEFGPLGRVEVERAAEAVPSVDGSHAFVANRSGIHSVDVTDPANPEIVATRDLILNDDNDGPMRLVMDCKVDGDRLLVAGPGQPSSVGYHGLALFDVSDPADPTLATSHETTYPIHNCFLDGRLAYLARGTGIEIVDVGRADPQPVSRWRPTDADEAYFGVDRLFKTMHDVYVQDGRAYLANWDLGTFIVDVTDPYEPEHLATVSRRPVEELEQPENPDEYLEPPGNDHYVQPSDDGTLLGVGMESWTIDPPEDGTEDTGGPSGIELWDISDLGSPSQVATIDPPGPPEGKQALRNEAVGYWTTAHNFDVVGDYLYSSWYQGGVRVHDISDPANPEKIAAWEDGDAASFWTAKLAVAGEFFVASDEGAYDTRRGALYTFPDPSDLTPQSTPDPTPTWTPTASPTPTSTPSPTATPTSGDPTTMASGTPTSTPTDSPTPTRPPEETEAEATANSGSGPGFGVLAGLSGLGFGTWWLLGDDGEDDGQGGKP